MKEITKWLHENTGINSDIQLKILASVLTIMVIWSLRVLIMKVVMKQTSDMKVQYHWRKSVIYSGYFLGLILIGAIWIKSIQSLATFFGLLSAGIAIALRDPLVNLAGWTFILWRKPFVVGDRIQVGNYSGDVIDIRLFQFSLIEIGNWVDADQSTGRMIHIPNGKVFQEMQANYTAGFEYIWHEIPVLITFESDWRQAKQLLQKIVLKNTEHMSQPAEQRIRMAAQKFMIFYNKLTPIVYTSVKDSGVLLTMRFICDPRKRRGTSENIWEDILDEFAKHKDIDLAYPTTRFYNNVLEGKKAKTD